MRHHILSYRDRVVKVNDSVPQSTRDKDSLPGVLDKLNESEFISWVFLLNLGQYFNKIVDGLVLIVLSSELLPFYYRLRNMRGKEDPSFMPNK